MIAELFICEIAGWQAVTLGICLGLLLAIPMGAYVAREDARRGEIKHAPRES